MAAALAVLAFLVYNANGREAYPTGDSRPTALLPFSILYEHDLDLDEYHPASEPATGPIRRENGHVLSNYSPLPAFLSLPIYLPAWPLRGEVNGDIFRWEPFFSKLAGSVWASLAVAVFFLAAAEVASQRSAALAALVLAFGSPFWISAGQTLGQHGLTVLLASTALLSVARLERTGRRRWALVAGIACALAAGIRLPNLVLFVAFLGYLLIHRPRSALAFAAPALALGAPFALLLLGILGGHSGGLQALAFLGRIGDQFASPFRGSLPALLVSPGEGLFVWAPVLLLLLLPVAEALASRGRSETAPLEGPPRHRLLVLCAVLFGLLLLLYASYVVWWGGRTYGPRYLTDALPFLLLPAAAGLEPWLERRAFWAAFVVLLLWSAYVQALGAFRYPCPGPDASLWRPDEERVWIWGETDISFCARSLRRPPQDFETFGRLLRLDWERLTR